MHTFVLTYIHLDISRVSRVLVEEANHEQRGREGQREREREREREWQSPVNPKPFKHETHLKTQEAPCDDFNNIFLHSGSVGVSDEHFETEIT